MTDHKDARQLLADVTTMRIIDREFAALTLKMAAAKQRIAELEAERQWQLIETAPKDGTPVDLWGYDQRLPDCRWLKEQNGYAAWHTFSNDRWVNVGSDFSFTHWMSRRPPSPHEGAQS